MTQPDLYLSLSPFVVLCLTLCAFFMGMNRRDNRFGSLFLLILVIDALVILSVLELGANNSTTLLLVSRFSYLAICLIPVAWLTFCIEYTLGRPRWFGPLFITGLLLVPAVTCIFAFTNPLHHLLWQANQIGFEDNRLINRVTAYGPWFWVHFAYCYALFFVGAGLMIRNFFYQSPHRRVQSLLTLAGVTLPLGFNLLYVFKLLPDLVRDFSPLVMALSGPLFLVGIYHNKLFGYSVLGKQDILSQIREGLVLIDHEGFVLDMNRTAGLLLDASLSGPLRLDELLEGIWPRLAALDAPEASLELHALSESGRQLEISAQMMVLNRLRHKGYLLRFKEVAAPEISGAAHGSIHGPESTELSPREQDIYDLLVQGCSNKDICAKLYISENTAKTHIRRILRKTGAKNRKDLARANPVG